MRRKKTGLILQIETLEKAEENWKKRGQKEKEGWGNSEFIWPPNIVKKGRKIIRHYALV